MRVVRGAEFTGERAWDADLIATVDGATVRVHWTDAPYVWHVNDGDEVFAVLDGSVDMYVRDADGEHVHRLGVGDVFHADPGCEHVARPREPSRILVVERAGSI